MKISILGFLLLFQMSSCHQASIPPRAFHLVDNQQKAKSDKVVRPNSILKSTDGGQTWQDISKGLPKNLRIDTIRGNSLFANEKGLFLKVGNQLYHSTPNAKAPFWTKEISPEHSSIAPGISDKNYWGINLKKTDGTSVWSPVFDNIEATRMRSVYETARGEIFILSAKGLFKTANDGKTWKTVHTEGMDGNLAESNGVLVAVSMRRIIRSTDNGETWAAVTNDNGVVFDVKPIKTGFAATTASSESGTKSLRISYDAGKSWQSTDAVKDKDLIAEILRTWDHRPRLQFFISSIIQVGEDFFCTHADGIFKSSDKGITWNLLLPSVKDKVFSLLVSGNVIYAIPTKGGC